MPKQGVSDAQLQANLDYACGQGIDCSKIQAGGPCFDPNTVSSHAAYAMNLYYQAVGRTPGSCDFTQTATLTSTNPSKFYYSSSYKKLLKIYLPFICYSLIKFSHPLKILPNFQEFRCNSFLNSKFLWLVTSYNADPRKKSMKAKSTSMYRKNSIQIYIQNNHKNIKKL